MPPLYSDYVYSTAPLTSVFDRPAGGTVRASLFLGEWMKRLPPPDGTKSRTRMYVRYRGGEGWVDKSLAGDSRPLEISFLSVGQGDSILIQTPDDRRILVDGGLGDEAHHFLANKYRLDKPDNFIDFDAVIATHSDADHVGGLVPVLEDRKIAVRRFLHNGLFPGAFSREGKRVTGLLDDPTAPGARGKLSPGMRRLAKALDRARENLAAAVEGMRAQGRQPAEAMPLQIRRLNARDGFVEGHGEAPLSIEVLWPHADLEAAKPSYAWYGSPAETVNGNSVVLRLTHGPHSVLLAGDLNEPSRRDVARRHGARLCSHVFKAAHHGSQHFDLEFLNLVQADAAVISAGDDRDDQHGHPRAALLGSIVHASKCLKPAVFVTELACCYRPLSKRDMGKFRASQGQLYERSIQGVVHLRSDGRRLCLGTVFGRKAPGDEQANTRWKWDWWETG